MWLRMSFRDCSYDFVNFSGSRDLVVSDLGLGYFFNAYPPTTVGRSRRRRCPSRGEAQSGTRGDGRVVGKGEEL